MFFVPYFSYFSLFSLFSFYPLRLPLKGESFWVIKSIIYVLGSMFRIFRIFRIFRNFRSLLLPTSQTLLKEGFKSPLGDLGVKILNIYNLYSKIFV